MTPRRDQDDKDEAELEELNRSSATSTFLEKRWWRWLAIAIAVLMLASFAVPVLLPLIGGAQPPDVVLEVPDFTLASANRGTVTLSQRVASNDFVVLVFYRTYY